LNYLIDTDVLSAQAKRRPNPRIDAFLSRLPDDAQYLSVVTLAEIARGVHLQRRRDPGHARALERWLNHTRSSFASRIVPISPDIALRWAELTVRLGHVSLDLMIAATALVHDMTVVTGNIRHFKPTGARAIDPTA